MSESSLLPEPPNRPDHWVFRMKLIPLTVSTYVLSQLALQPLICLVFFGEPRLMAVVAIAYAVGYLPLGFASALAVWLLLPVQVSAAGLRGFSFWGVPRTCIWDEVTRARRLRVLGLLYVRVWTTGRSAPLWIPLFLRDRQGFDAAVATLAPPNNPFRLATNPPAEGTRSGGSADDSEVDEGERRRSPDSPAVEPLSEER